MGKNLCKLCGEMVEEKIQGVHEYLDEWLLKLVLSKHPEWKQSDGACPRCIEAINKMKREKEIIE